MAAVHEELVEVWMTPSLRDALLERRVYCSAVMLNREANETFSLALQVPRSQAVGYTFPVTGEDAEQIAATRRG